MSENAPEPTGEQAPPANEWKPPASQEDLDRIITERLTRERAKYSDYEDLKAKETEYNQYLESQKTDEQRRQEEAEKANAEREQERKDAAEARAELARTRAALKYKLTEEDLELLQFVPAEQVEETAEKISKRLHREVTPDFDGGHRTPPPAAPSMNNIIRQAAGRG